MFSRPKPFIADTLIPELPCGVEMAILAAHDVIALFDQMKYRGMASIPRHLQIGNDDDHHGEGEGLVTALLHNLAHKTDLKCYKY